MLEKHPKKSKERGSHQVPAIHPSQGSGIQTVFHGSLESLLPVRSCSLACSFWDATVLRGLAEQHDEAVSRLVVEHTS